MASRGGGPDFVKWGPRAMYKWSDVVAWAERHLTQKFSSTAEVKAFKAENERKHSGGAA
jgi:hypothetical protein